MDINFLRGIATVVVMIGFFGICWWAYFYRSKESFKDAANAPFLDEPDPENLTTEHTEQHLDHEENRS